MPFSHYVELGDKQDSKDIANATKHCQDIMRHSLRSRTVISKRNTEGTKLDKLPQDVIGYIASFLSQRSYSKFSRCNRSIYLDCNTPNTLREIVSPWLDAQDRWLCALDLPDFSLFPYVQRLHLSVHELPDEKGTAVIDSISKMRRLKAISFYDDGHSSSLETMKRVAAKKDIAERMDRLGVMLGDAAEPDILNLITMIMSFKNIKYLDLSVNSRDFGSSEDDDNALLDRFESTFANLKGLTLGNMMVNSLGWSLLRASGHQLQFLALFNVRPSWVSIHQLKLVEFWNLRELQLDHESFLVSGGILKSARNLQKIRIDYIEPSEFKQNRIRKCTEQIGDWFTSCPLMHHLQIHAVNGLVLDAIERGLRSRGQLKDTECSSSMKIVINGWAAGQMGLLKSKVKSILQAMLICDLDDSMLILKMEQPFTGDVSFKDTAPSGMKVLHDLESGNRGLVVFSNTDCNINGYGEHWLMEPSASFWD